MTATLNQTHTTRQWSCQFSGFGPHLSRFGWVKHDKIGGENASNEQEALRETRNNKKLTIRSRLRFSLLAGVELRCVTLITSHTVSSLLK